MSIRVDACDRTGLGPVVGEVRLTPVLTADPPLLNAHGVHQPYAPRLVIEVVTDGGTTGLGETYGETKYLGAARALADALPGLPLSDLNGLDALAASVCGTGEDAGAGADVHGMRGVMTADKLRLSVVSGFEAACLDALGKELGLPVHALLGGRVRDRVEYSAYLFYRWAAHPGGRGEPDGWGAALDPDGIVAQARRFAAEHGFRSFKLKGGVFPPVQEMAAVRALAHEFPGSPLRLDPNGAWSVETARRVESRLRDVLEYLEDPVPGTPAMAEVAASARLPLATNMCVTTVPEISEAFASDAVQIVLSDHHYWGGLRRTRELAAICAAFGVGLSMHSNTHLGISLAAMTHVAATVPVLAYACDTHYPWQTEDVLTRRHTFRDGALPVSDEPGLGVELDRAALAALHERWLADDGTMRDRDDVAAMRVAEPGWLLPAWPRW